MNRNQWIAIFLIALTVILIVGIKLPSQYYYRYQNGTTISILDWDYNANKEFMVIIKLTTNNTAETLDFRKKYKGFLLSEKVPYKIETGINYDPANITSFVTILPRKTVYLTFIFSTPQNLEILGHKFLIPTPTPIPSHNPTPVYEI